MARAVVCVTGMPGSGKTLVARCLAERLGKYVNMGDVVRAKASEAGLAPTSENLLAVARELRRRYGPDVVARELVGVVSGYDGVVVVDGIRGLEEVRVFSSVAPTVVVAVHSSPSTRYLRLRGRGRADDPSSYEEFESRDLRELELGVGAVIALADVVVVNEGKDASSLCEEAFERVRGVLGSVLAEGGGGG